MSLTAGTGRPTLPDKVNRAIFLRLSTDPVVRLWSGRGKIRIDANDLDVSPQVYDGLGVIQGLPEIDRLLNGDARRLDVALSGLDASIAALVDQEAVGTVGCRARFGHIRYSRTWEPLSDIRWAWDGRLDEMGLEMLQVDGGHEWKLTVSMSSAMVERRRPQLLYWTPVQQKAIHPTDTAFDLVPSYNAGSTRLYPPR